MLPKFTLSLNDEKDVWQLRNDMTNRVLKNFDTKGEALEGGVMKDLLGNNGGSVKIQKENHIFQEERTYPRSKDPSESKG
ncbi:MAG: DUF2188 domain-containing protein [Patescibacteria group bacterium]|jgi:hypothetical protein